VREVVFKRTVLGIVVFIIYIVAIIPLSPYLMSIVSDFVNNSANILVWNYSTVKYVYNATTDTFEPQAQVITLDFRQVLIFIAELLIYFVLPLAILVKVFER
jgi:hypothetical protein